MKHLRMKKFVSFICLLILLYLSNVHCLVKRIPKKKSEISLKSGPHYEIDYRDYFECTNGNAKSHEKSKECSSLVSNYQELFEKIRKPTNSKTLQSDKNSANNEFCCFLMKSGKFKHKCCNEVAPLCKNFTGTCSSSSTKSSKKKMDNEKRNKKETPTVDSNRVKLMRNKK